MNAKEFGSRIRKAREDRGLSQDELAALISKDQRAIYEYEAGKRRLAAIDLPTLARALGVSVAYFYEENIPADELDRVMLREFQRLPSLTAKRGMIELLRAFSDTLLEELSGASDKFKQL